MGGFLFHPLKAFRLRRCECGSFDTYSQGVTGRLGGLNSSYSVATQDIKKFGLVSLNQGGESRRILSFLGTVPYRGA